MQFGNVNYAKFQQNIREQFILINEGTFIPVNYAHTELKRI